MLYEQTNVVTSATDSCGSWWGSSQVNSKWLQKSPSRSSSSPKLLCFPRWCTPSLQRLSIPGLGTSKTTSAHLTYGRSPLTSRFSRLVYSFTLAQFTPADEAQLSGVQPRLTYFCRPWSSPVTLRLRSPSFSVRIEEHYPDVRQQNRLYVRFVIWLRNSNIIFRTFVQVHSGAVISLVMGDVY